MFDFFSPQLPFAHTIINLQWDAEDPSNRDKWSVQHGMIKHLQPPYVYHVLKGDRDGFVKALEYAASHPIAR